MDSLWPSAVRGVVTYASSRISQFYSMGGVRCSQRAHALASAGSMADSFAAADKETDIKIEGDALLDPSLGPPKPEQKLPWLEPTQRRRAAAR